MSQLLGWFLQVLILALGIYWFLRFVRATRGSTLLRGLGVTLFFGVLGIWALTELLRLEELGHLMQGIAGFVVVIFVVVFQPELRRGISQLGESQRIGRLMGKLRSDTASRVAEAAASLASRRQGALIAFERETPLDSYVAEGVRIDAAVSRLLIESLFHPGGALHDGAVVVRRDRIAAASCLFPLSENPDLAREIGTRHRAAIGITEETDAVTLAVSEETGSISICRRGVQIPGVARDDVALELRRALRIGSARGTREDAPRARQALLTSLRRDWVWLGASVLIACAILFSAHRDIRESREYMLRLALSPSAAGAAAREPGHGELLLVPPGADWLLASPAPPALVRVEADGSRRSLDALGTALSGELRLDDEVQSGRLELSLERVRWRSRPAGVRIAWVGDKPPVVELERLTTRRFPLVPACVPVDAQALDPRFEVALGELSLSQLELVLEGPESALDEVEDGELALALETVVLTPADTQDRRERLDLAPELRARGLSLPDGPVAVTVPVLPATREIGVVVKEVALVSLGPGRAADLEHWALPAHAQTARLSVSTVGLIPATSDPSSPAVRERTALVRRFVEDNLAVFVDVAELPTSGGRSLAVRWVWRKDWRKSLTSLGLDTANLSGREGLFVRLLSDTEILLVEREPHSSDAGAPNGTSTPGGSEEERP